MLSCFVSHELKILHRKLFPAAKQKILAMMLCKHVSVDLAHDAIQLPTCTTTLVNNTVSVSDYATSGTAAAKNTEVC